MKIKHLAARCGLFLSCAMLGNAASAASIDVGDLVVSELLANPAAVSDTNGEWLELYNASQHSIDLNGLVLRDNGSNTHTINAAQPLVILPGAYKVLGRNGDSASNGGYLADYVYSNFSLSNGSDSIVLERDNTTVFSLTYTAGDNFGAAGTSMELQQLAASIDPSLYMAAQESSIFGAGDRGTPGTGPLDPSVSEVPLPAAGWLLCSSLGLLGGVSRRGKTA